jgi:hypothetical protein
MVRPDTSESSTKQVHLKTRKHVDMYNELRSAGENISKIFSDALERKYEERYGISSNKQEEQESISSSLLALIPISCKTHAKTITDLYQQEEFGCGGKIAVNPSSRHPLVIHLKKTIPYQHCPECIRWCKKVDEYQDKQFRELKEKAEREAYESDPIHYGNHEAIFQRELKTHGVDTAIARLNDIAESECCPKCAFKADQYERHFREYRARLKKREEEELMKKKQEQELKQKLKKETWHEL